MKVSCKVASADTTADALDELRAQFGQITSDVSAVFAFYGCCHDGGAIGDFLRSQFPGAALIGGSSSGGVMDRDGVHGANSVGVFTLQDLDGDYGAAAAPLGDDPASAAEAALHAALAQADCVGELPALIWVYQAPGQEEGVLDGLRRVVGDRCPVIGGSSADDAVAGDWSQLGPDGRVVDSVVVAVLFPSTAVSFAFQGGYEPSGQTGRVTRVDATSSGRTILEIDGEPAARVYDRWAGDAIRDKLEDGGSILAQTTMAPLAVATGLVDGLDQYLLIHPESVDTSGALSTFASVEEGVQLLAMRGNAEQLVERAGRVMKQAVDRLDEAAPAGALMVYCAGCRMAVAERVHDVPGQVRDALGDAPLIGCFTFGEQGVLAGRSVHGNLMISSIVFAA